MSTKSVALALLLTVPILPLNAETLSAEWQQTLAPRFAVWIHVPSISRTLNKTGETTLKIWSILDLSAPIVQDSKRILSLKTLTTIYCDERLYESDIHGYAGLGASGEELASTHDSYANLVPDTYQDALAFKYCSAWKFWR
jgi:hypothetical protein